MFEWFIAYRYFKSKQAKGSFLNFIKKMAVGGVAVGAAGLLISLSVAHGFKNVIKDKIQGFGPDITVKTYSTSPIQRADTLITFLRSHPEVDVIQPVVYAQGMIQHGENVEGILLKGIDSTDRVTRLPSFIEEGSFTLRSETADDRLSPLVMGKLMAQKLGVGLNETASYYAIQGMPSRFNLPRIKQFRVAGIYSTDIDRLDNAFVITDLETARSVSNLSSIQCSEIELTLSPGTDIEEFNTRLDGKMPYPITTDSIYETYGSIFAWINLQEQTIPFVISIMIIVAAFNLIGTVLMMILERTGDVGILKTMGADDSRILKVFLIEGLMIAVYGLLIGIGISVAFYFIQDTWKVIPLPAENYYMTYAPVEPHLFDFVLVTVVTIVLCVLSSVIPARVAARLNPLKVIAFGRG